MRPAHLLLVAALFPLSLLRAQAGDRLTERRLGDVAVMRVPARIKEAMYVGYPAEASRLTYAFGARYFWASFGSGPAYRQQIFISVMAPDATAEDYARPPYWYSLSYDKPVTVHEGRIGSGTLVVKRGNYQQNTLSEPSLLYRYEDRARRLSFLWHSVIEDVPLERGIALVGRMAESFRLLREPAAEFAEARDRPRREAEAAAGKVALAKATLAREGIGPLQEATPVEKGGIWYEWTEDPEPRLQMFVPLGRVKATPGVIGGLRPRPVSLRNKDGTVRNLAGTVGWWEFWEGEWRSSNHENDYLPFTGLAARLATEHRDPAWVVFYYSASLRVELSGDDALRSFDWFRRSVPEVQQLWREGALVHGAIDEAPFPLPARRP